MATWYHLWRYGQWRSGLWAKWTACDQLVEFATRIGNIEQNQSAYRVGHSTESALLKVKYDLLHALDNQEVTCLVLLNLSAAFDTVDHDLLLN